MDQTVPANRTLFALRAQRVLQAAPMALFAGAAPFAVFKRVRVLSCLSELCARARTNQTAQAEPRATTTRHSSLRNHRLGYLSSLLSRAMHNAMTLHRV